MILGRNAALWVAFAAAIINVAVVVFHVNLTPEGIAALNTLALVFVGLIANEADPTTLGTFAASITPPTIGKKKLTTGDTSVPSAAVPSVPTADQTVVDPVPQSPQSPTNSTGP